MKVSIKKLDAKSITKTHIKISVFPILIFMILYWFMIKNVFSALDKPSSMILFVIILTTVFVLGSAAFVSGFCMLYNKFGSSGIILEIDKNEIV